MMRRGILGRTGIELTELGFGALPFGPLQKGLGAEEAADVLALALAGGVNFVDGARVYGTYGVMRRAMEMTGIRPVISAKSSERTGGEMEKAFKETLDGLGVGMIDIYLLHGVRDEEDGFASSRGAWERLLNYKAEGRIKAVGVSTHSAKVTAAMAEEPEIDVVFPLINRIGRGIRDGTRAEMERAISACLVRGKGVYLMKVLGGGTLIDEYQESIAYARGLGGFTPIVLGMVSRREVEFNLDYFNGTVAPDRLPSKQGYQKRITVVKRVCMGCRACAKACLSGALTYDGEGKGLIDPEKCVQCGYCISACPSFAVRVI